MKRSLFVIVASTVICSAQAADLPSQKPAPPIPVAPIGNWNGFYFGANVGGGFPNSGSGGVIGGGQFGYNYQFSPFFVAGLETDIQGTSIGGDAPPFGFHPDRGLGWFGTVRGRVGDTAINPKVLIYGTGGFAYGGSDGTATGWTAGGGVEWAFASNWSAKLEYLYVDLSDDSNFHPHGRDAQAFHVIRAGLNYRFDPFAPFSPPKSF